MQRILKLDAGFCSIHVILVMHRLKKPQVIWLSSNLDLSIRVDKWGKGKFHVVSFDYIKLNTALTATQWPTSSELKIKFDPSLDRSWCEFFKIIKNHGPKNPPPGCNLGPKFPPSCWSLVRKKNDDLTVQYEDVHD